jgi:hypothetical protein
MIAAKTLIRSLSRGSVAMHSRKLQSLCKFSTNTKAYEIQTRNITTTQQVKSTAQSAVEMTSNTDTTVEKENFVTKRMVVTGEVIVSKIFPAGFGWQSSSILAENHLGFASDSVAFALTTGVGDGLGVLIGHCGFYGIKKMVTGNEKIMMKRELDTGILLASAAFCSGSLWQPLVDFLQSANISFAGVFTGTWIGCGTAFYVGLRAGRTFLPNVLEYVEEPTYENSKTDASLSVAIGGATGCFVGTDAAYLPEQNFLIDLVGITDGTPDLTGCCIAGTSTSIGFLGSQSVLNIFYPKGKCWND